VGFRDYLCARVSILSTIYRAPRPRIWRSLTCSRDLSHAVHDATATVGVAHEDLPPRRFPCERPETSGQNWDPAVVLLVDVMDMRVTGALDRDPWTAWRSGLYVA
jgi:hypothetical protein